MARTTTTSQDDDTTPKDLDVETQKQDPETLPAPEPSNEDGDGTTETAKSLVVASDEGDAIKMPAPSGEGEIFVGSVSKVIPADENAAPSDTYNGQCSLCAQSYDGEDQGEVTDQLNKHYRAAHVYYDGSGL